MPWTIEKLNNYGNPDNGWTVEKLNNYNGPKKVAPIQNNIIEPTPKKSGFLDTVFGKDARAEFDRTHQDTPNFLKPVGFALESVNRIPLTNRLLNQSADFLGVKRINGDGSEVKTLSTGNKIADTLTDVGANLIGSSLAGPGGGSNLLNATDGIAKIAGGKVAALTGNKLLPALARGSVDAAASVGLEDFSKGNFKQLPQDVAINALGGGVLGGGGQLVGDVARNVVPKLGKLLPDLTANLSNVKPKDLLSDLVTTNSKVTQIGKPLDEVLNPKKLFNKDPIKADLNAPIKVQNPLNVESNINALPLKNDILKAQEPTLNMEGKLKESKFKTNTMRNAEMLQGEETQKTIDNIKAMYEVKPNEQSVARATEELKRNPQAVINRIKSSEALNSAEDATAAGLITNQLRQEADSTGDFTKLKEWLETVQPKVTNTAQGLQALSTWKSMDVNGVLTKAQQVVGQVQRALKDTNPKLMEQADTMSNKLAKEIDKINNDAINEISKEIDKVLPQQVLAEKISSKVNTPKGNKIDVENQMINTLFNVAKKTLPQNEIAQNDPIEFVKLAYENKSKYQDVWSKAKGILQDLYKNDSEKLSVLDDYFNQKLKPVFFDKDLNKSINMQLKEMNVDLGTLVREHYSKGSKVREALADTLINKAGLTGEDAANLEKYINNRMKELTKSKKEQILAQMFKDKPTPVQKTMFEKVIEMSNLGGFQNNNYKNIVYEKLGIPQLSNEDIRFINDTMKKVEAMADGREKDIEFAKVKQVISDKIPSTLTDKVKSLQRISLLLNPKTLISRNPLGNVILGGLENIKDIPGSLTDMAVSLKTGQRTTLAPSLQGVATQVKGFGKGFKETLQDAKLNVNTNPAAGQFELPQTPTFKNGVLGKLEKVTNTGLELGDRPFYQGAYDDYIRQQLKINKVNVPTESMIEKAKAYAEERTLQNTSALVDGFKKLQQGLNQVSTGNKDLGIGTFALPFTKTPANILDKAIDYSPIGTIKGISQLMSKKEFDQKKFVDRIGRSLTGSAMIMLGYDLAKDGKLTGKANKDKDVAALEKQTGKSAYAFKIGDTYRTFDWMQPAAIPLAIGADIFHEGKNSKEATNIIAEAIKSGGTTLFSQSLLQGVQRLFGGYDLMGGIGSTLSNIPTQFVPTALKSTAQLTDGTQRDTYDPNKNKSILNQLKAKIPGASKTLEPKIDTLGRETQQFQGNNSLFNVLLNPGFTTKENATPGEKMVLDIYKDTGDKIQFPRVANTSITYKKDAKNSETIQLNSKEKTEFQKYIGEKTSNAFDNLANNTNFTTKTSKEKAKELQSLLTKIYNEGEDYILKGRGISEYKK